MIHDPIVEYPKIIADLSMIATRPDASYACAGAFSAASISRVA